MEKSKKLHIRIILNYLFEIIKEWIIPFFFIGIAIIKSNSFFTGFLYLIIIAAVVFMAFLAFMKWKNSYFKVDELTFFYKTGVFFKTKREIPIDKIQNIDITRKFMHRVLGISLFKLDSGNAGKDTEVKIIMLKKEAEDLKQFISGLQNSSVMIEKVLIKEEDNSVRISVKDLLLAGLTSNSIITGLLLIFFLYNILDDFIVNLFSFDVIKLIKEFNSQHLQTKSLNELIFFGVAAFLTFIFIAVVCSVIGAFIKYYGFTIKRIENTLHISYGLFDKKNMTISISKIKALYIEQKFLRQFFNVESLGIETIGYGNEKGENAVLFPFLREKDREGFISEILPEFSYKGELSASPDKAVRNHIISNSWFPLIAVLILVPFFRLTVFLLALYPLFVLNALLTHKNSFVSYNGDKLCLGYRGFNKTIAIMPFNEIQSVSFKANYFMKKSKLMIYEFSIHANTFGKSIKVKYLSDVHEKAFENIQ